jgi:hypothetical protein
MITSANDAAAPVSTTLMSAAEARACVKAVNAHLTGARELLLDLYEREGWRALGYDSWRACAVAEFQQSQSQLYYQLQAAQIERSISTLVENGAVPERHLRELAPLRGEPEAMLAIFRQLIETRGDDLTAADVREAVQSYRQLTPVAETVHARPGANPGKIRKDKFADLFWVRHRTFRTQMESADMAIQVLKRIQVPSKKSINNWSPDACQDYLRYMSKMRSELQEVLSRLGTIELLLAAKAAAKAGSMPAAAEE